VISLLTLGVTLSLDNFRIAIALGGLKPTLRRSVKTSFIFGLWDGIAPLVGILVGQYLSEKIDSTATTIAAVGLGAYGLFVVVRSLVSPEDADPDMRWATRGLPLPLSVDNVAAGASLGLAGYSPWLAPALFGMITFVMSVAGHQIGRTAARLIPRIRTDLLTGLAFVAMAALVAVGGGGD
jgi:manganese efflux pump family protein